VATASKSRDAKEGSLRSNGVGAIRHWLRVLYELSERTLRCGNGQRSHVIPPQLTNLTSEKRSRSGADSEMSSAGFSSRERSRKSYSEDYGDNVKKVHICDRHDGIRGWISQRYVKSPPEAHSTIPISKEFRDTQTEIAGRVIDGADWDTGPAERLSRRDKQSWTGTHDARAAVFAHPTVRRSTTRLLELQ
jgi:hypothetical protein